MQNIRGFSPLLSYCMIFFQSPDSLDFSISDTWFKMVFKLVLVQIHIATFEKSLGGRIRVDTKGKFSWTKWVNHRGHFLRNLLDIFGELLWKMMRVTLLSSNNLTLPNLT